MPNDETDQEATIAFLADPATHGAPVTRLETHGAIVFLTGPHAYKLKRAVRFSYMDFSSRALRRRACEAELVLNRRTAPTLYLGVVAVTRQGGRGLALGGDGEAVDWVVKLRRFEQDQLLSRMADAGTLEPAILDALADTVAAFHESAEKRPDRGGRAGMAEVVAGNALALAEAAPVVPRDRAERLIAEAAIQVERHGALLEARRLAGRVRHGHGDLHLNNVVLLDGRPTPFDAIEFDDRLASVDVLYDVAFLVMDCLHRDLSGAANRFLNRYVERAHDIDGLALMPLFLSLRALIRAHVAASTARAAADPGEAARQRRQAGAYLALAERLIRAVPARMVALGGYSGTGKTTLARGLAPVLGAPPGALVLRSDVARKRLLGLAPEDRAGPEAYAEAVTRRVYDSLAEDASAALAAGRAVIVDAVHARPEERARIADVARRAGVPFTGLWLEVPAELATRRVSRRRGDASDADAAVVAEQFGRDPGPIAWPRVAADGTADSTLAAACAMLRADGLT